MLTDMHFLEKVVIVPNLKDAATSQIGKVYLAFSSVRELKIDVIIRARLNQKRLNQVVHSTISINSVIETSQDSVNSKLIGHRLRRQTIPECFPTPVPLPRDKAGVLRPRFAWLNCRPYHHDERARRAER